MPDPLFPGGTGLRFAVGAAVLLLALVGLAVPAETWIARGTARVGQSALLGLWAPMVDAQAAVRGIAPVLALGLIATESGGDYLAIHVDPGGTVDAGLGQVNQIHWPTFDLQADPFDPERNVAASLDLLRAAMDRHPHDVAAALEAYNGFGPGYARAVLAAAARIAGRPALNVWPVSGRRRGDLWSAPASDGRSGAFLIVTAYDAEGTSLATPDRLTLTRNGRPLTLAPAAVAPAALRAVTPPQAAYRWTVVALPPGGGAVRVTVTAAWRPPARSQPRNGAQARDTVILSRTLELASSA